MRFFKKFLLIFASLFTLPSCANAEYAYLQKNINIAAISIEKPADYDGVIEIGKFNEAGLKIKVRYEDNTSELFAFTENLIPTDYKQYLTTPGKYELDILFRGYTTTFKFEMSYFYNVTFKNEGVTLFVDHVKAGDEAVYEGETPTKPSTNTLTYTFSNWDKELRNVQESFTTNAVFNSSERTYKITWSNFDGTILSTEYYHYNDIPSYKGDIPTREKTDQHSFTFKGWSPSISSVKTDVNYVAQYDYYLNSYSITWLNWDNSLLKTSSVYYGYTPVYNGETPTRPDVTGYHFVFKGWSPEIVPVKGNATYKAEFEKIVNSYTITWLNWDGSLLRTSSCDHGTIPSYNGSTPKKEGTVQWTYVFKGWSPELVEATADATYKAVFEQTLATYTITWLNWDGSTLEVDTKVPYGTTPEYNGETPSRTSTSVYTYTFIGWSPEVSQVTKNAVYRAQFKINYPLFTFKTTTGNECTLHKVDPETIGDIIVPETWEGHTVTAISDNALKNCYNVEKVVLPDTIKTIGANAFYNCYKLKEINIPSGVTSISNYAFYWCSSLLSIALPSTITSIGDYAFYNCDSLSSLHLPSFLKTIGKSSFEGCGFKSIVLPNGTESIGASAFGTYLNTVVIPSTLTQIGNNAIPKRDIYVYYQGNQSSWNRIRSSFSASYVELNSVVTSLTDIFDGRSSYILSDTNEITDLKVSDANLIEFDSAKEFPTEKIKSLAQRAFQDCVNLEDIKGLNDLVYIGAYAFIKTKIKSLILPEGLIFIGDYSFSGLESLDSIVLPSSLQEIGRGVFNYCSSLTSITIPDSVWSLGKFAFANCENLSNIGFGASLGEINESCFEGCNSLTSIVVPRTVWFIGLTSFKDCASLRNVFIPVETKYVKSGAFEGCSNLTIYCEASSRPSTWDNGWEYRGTTYPTFHSVVWGASMDIFPL